MIASILAVVLVAAGTAWAVAAVIGPIIFHDHMLQASHHDVAEHAELAFRAASELSLALALLVALVTSVIVTLFLTGRIGRSLASVRDAASEIADGDYGARVPQVGVGVEFDDLATAFNTMAADLEQIEGTRRQMLGDLAHEMRTPVATLNAYVEAVTDGVAPASEATWSVLREQVTRLERLAEDVNLVTTSEEGRLSMHRRSIDVAELLTAAATQAAQGYAAKDVHLHVDASPAADSSVHADADRMGQVLTNLLDNALRHTQRGGHVWLRAVRVGEVVRVIVRDDGDGISSEHLPHVFERFYRGDRARDRAHGGSGIGLAIVRSIVRAHGGTVHATSPGHGQGATFTVELPAVL
ncbi:sensor histidine kinase [Occultella aeris]|uniref:sensor histidine kinase n=1 Tax=Occultella aeris TaxID=2761496 RepID=UPI001E520A54|nr:ATP-binding protein [Occultella aeris]